MEEDRRKYGNLLPWLGFPKSEMNNAEEEMEKILPYEGSSVGAKERRPHKSIQVKWYSVPRGVA
ncbi:uncharacterized protein G2W53_016073 [Senna tora]|uniref:Uncharacterized protein n=1 Tax=Senna tora TaxID=362788 RepID=A0A834WWQ5_9FABA|nr:uncharacterized protein G2W53_016073 [Senna tora]